MAHGVIDVKCWPADVTHMYNEAYVTIVNFLLGAAPGVDVTLIASYYGVGGTGNGYWDSATPCGNGAFTVWKFNSSPTPFYMLLSYNNNNSPAVGNSAPCLVDGTTINSRGVYVAFAACDDPFMIPWNGTTMANGADTKGTPVWSGGPFNLMVWPRSNSIGGARAAARDDTMHVIGETSYGDFALLRFHFVCDNNNVFFASDNRMDGSYMPTYFGRFMPRNGMSPAVPLVALRSDLGYSVEGQNPPFTRNTYPGSNYWGGPLNGGIAHPVNPTLGVRNVRPDHLAQFGDSAYFPPSTSPVQTPEFPIWVAMDEGTSYVGHCGYIDFIRYSYGMTNQAMNTTKTRAFIGNNTPASWKVSMPWDGVTYCGTGQSRAGVIF